MKSGDERSRRVAAFRVMTYNLRCDVAADGAHRWDGRRELLLHSIRQAQPDILGTQEGLPHQLADLDAALPGHHRISRSRDGSGLDEACAIHTARARFKPVEGGTFWLSETPDVPASVSWGSRHPRIVTWTRLLDRETAREVTIANTHLDHASPQAREHGARLLAARLPGAILMGDFNAAPGEAAHSILIDAGWTDGGAREPTYHGFTGRASARIDHIFVPPGHRLVATHVLAPMRDGIHGSDHHAVVADLDPN